MELRQATLTDDLGTSEALSRQQRRSIAELQCQYSTGKSRVVTERSHSVMTQTTTPAAIS